MTHTNISYGLKCVRTYKDSEKIKPTDPCPNGSKVSTFFSIGKDRDFNSVLEQNHINIFLADFKLRIYRQDKVIKRVKVLFINHLLIRIITSIQYLNNLQ